MLWNDCPAGVTLPPATRLDPFPEPETGEPPVPWSELKTEIPWGALEALTPDEYSPTFRTYLEALTISKDDLIDWCIQHDEPQPLFWSHAQPSSRRSLAQEDRKAATKTRNDKIQREAEKIWREAWNNGTRLHKERVATKLREHPDAADLCRDLKQRDGGTLSSDSLIRLISEPSWLKKHKTKGKDIPDIPLSYLSHCSVW